MNEIWHDLVHFFSDKSSPENGNYLVISGTHLFYAAGFIIAAGALSLWQQLKLEKSLLIGTLRTFVQLIAVGYLIKIIFGLDSPWLILGYFCFTAVMATLVVRSNIHAFTNSLFLPTVLSILVTGFAVTFTVSGVIVGATPWWEAQYFVPLGGMISGNAMSAVTIAFRNWFSGLRTHKNDIEMRLALGATPREASASAFQESLKLGMLPTITGMMSVGLVQLPGMMTGQILAGAAPTHAVRYQIVVMLMLTSATAIASFLALHFARKQSFGERDNLILPPEEKGKK